MMGAGRTLLPGWFVSPGAGPVARLGSILRRRKPGTFGLGSPPDADALATTLEVEKRAKDDGSIDLPPATEEVLAGMQRDIVDYHRQLQDGARRKLERLADRLSAATRRVDVPGTVERLRDIPPKCRNKVDRVVAEFDSKLSLLREQEARQRLRMDEGGEQDKEAGSGGVASKAIYFVLTLAMAGVASLALGSASVWGVGSDSLLGTDSAITIAVITVVVPFLVASAVSSPTSEGFDRDRPVFRMAAFLTTVFLALLAFFCAHLIVVSADGTASAAIASMMAEPGAIATDFNAWKGLSIVIVMGLLGFLLGNQSVGAGAESGSAREAYLRARREREELTSRLRKRINGIVDAAEKDVNRSAARLRSRVRKLSTLVRRAQDTEAYFDDYLIGLEECCNLLLERYREANVAARTSDAPPSFSEQICFRLDGASRPSLFEGGMESYRKIDGEMPDFSAVVAQARQELRSLNSDTIKDIESAPAPTGDFARDQETTQSAY